MSVKMLTIGLQKKIIPMDREFTHALPNVLYFSNYGYEKIFTYTKACVTFLLAAPLQSCGQQTAACSLDPAQSWFLHGLQAERGFYICK